MTVYWWERLEQYIFWAVTVTLGAVATSIGWLIRQVFTNQRQIELLREERRVADKLREEDRERMSKIESGVDRIESILMHGTRK